MYYPNDIEDVCYDMEHIDQVMQEIKMNIPEYFERYLDSEGGMTVTESEISKLAKAFGATSQPKSKKKNYKSILENIQKEAIQDFESDRKYYLDIFNEKSLKQYSFDVGSFKNTVLRNEVPIIRKTLQNKAAKELDKYRQAFKEAQPGKLFSVSKKLTELAYEWKTNWYNSQEFESISHIDDLGYYEFDEEECSAPGVIGGGIKSTFVYKLFPFMFPVRSREAVWAMWYLSGKKKFGCKEDSEFLMINKEKSTTQQNYFYPYSIFCFYALQIFLELKKHFMKHGVAISTEYRFVIVESFLTFVGICHQEETNLLKRDNSDYRYDD